MDIIVRQTTGYDYEFESLEITIDDYMNFHVYNSDNLEDNTLSRNFSDCYDIPELLKRAYLAGRKGEEFNIIYEDTDEE